MPRAVVRSTRRGGRAPGGLRRRALAALGAIALVGAFLIASGGRTVHEVRITLDDRGAADARGARRPGFDIDVSSRPGDDVADVPGVTERGALPDWIEPSTRRGGPGAPEQVIVTMGRDASAAITAHHVVLVRGDESVVLDIGGEGRVETPADAPAWVGREGPRAPVVARFGRAGSIEVAARGIRVQRRGPG